ncbi:adhesin, partial [Streptobacillus moniliformis]|uniref:adhesin n=1 Tax=Streptobacillus moniliformis TaxID=34105 RepID=UPI0009BE58F0
MKKMKKIEIKKFLKSSLKNKVSIDEKTVLRYIILGFAGLSAMSYGSWLAINDSTGTVGKSGVTSEDGENNSKNNVILAKYENTNNTSSSVVIGAGGKTYGKGSENVVIGFNANSEKSQSVVIGANTKSDLQNSVILGSKSYVYKDHFNIGNGVTEDDGQGVAIGNSVFSTAQATSIGNNTYAIGRSSIAIGNDDISAYENKVTQHDYDSYFKKLYEKIDKDGTLYGYGSNNKTDASKHKWSPTLAQGHGSIAIGSRSIAYADGSTALGTLAFALKKGSTAVGTLTRAEGEGAIAIGRETNVFANNAIAAGNKTLVLEEGGASYGLSAISGGKNSVAIGTDVYANVEYDYNNTNIELGGPQKAVSTGLFGKLSEYGKQDNDEEKRGLYGFDLNGVAKTLIGLGKDNPPNNVNGAQKGDYLKSGTYFNQYKSYIDGLESGLTNAKTKDTKKSTNSITIKTQTKNGVENIAKSSGKNAIVIGSKSGAFGDNGIALGRGSFSLKENSISIGSYSYTKEKNSIALGIASRALAEGSLTFGNGAGVDISGKNSMVYGHGSVAYAPNSIILGINSRVWGTDKDGDSIIIGNDANISELKDSNGTKLEGHNGKSVLALGNKTNATLDNSVALGYLSATDYQKTDLEKPGYTARGSYSIPTSAKVGVISVGKKGYERRIINVASGYRDSDAVNVAQLKTLEDRLDGATEETDDKVRYFSVNTDNDLNDIARKEVDYRNYVKLKTQMLTIDARKENGEQIKEENIKELKDKLTELENKNGTKDKATSLKNLGSPKDTKYKTNGSFNIDKYMEALEKAKQEDLSENRIKDILTMEEKNKIEEANYSNKGAKGKNSIAIGHSASTEQNAENAIAIGMGAKATSKNSIVLGSESKETADTNNAGYDITTKTSSNLMDPTWKPTHGEFAIGNDSTVTRRITGVAAGEKDTDAVNVAQLKQVSSGLLKDKDLKFAGDDGQEATVKLGETLNIKGEGTVANGTAVNNIKVTADKDSKTLTIGLSEDLKNISTIKTKKGTDNKETELSQTGIKVKGDNSKETEITSETVKINDDKDSSKLTSKGLEIGSKDGNDEKTNKLTKDSITLTDKSNGKEITNTITATSSEIKDKENNSVKIEANKITVSKGNDKVEITKDSLMGAITVGKDTNNSLIFGNDNNTSTMLKVGGKELTFTKAGEHIKISNVANGKDDNDAVNVSQLKEYATFLGGGAEFKNGTFTGPTYSLKAGSNTTTDHKNVGDALKALDDAIGASNTNIKALENKAITFQDNDGNEVKRKLGETLKIQGEGTVNGATAKDNIKVTKNDTDDGLDVKLAENLKNLNSIETKEEKGKKTKITTDGVEATNGTNKANLTADKLTFEAKDKSTDKTSTEVGKDGITLKDKSGNESVSIKTENNAGTITVKDKDGKDTIKINGEKGSITGLKDISPNEKDGSIAVNKNYVDSRIKAIANGPFEYESNDGKKVVRGEDGKLYKKEDLDKFYYDKTSSTYKPKNTTTNPQPTLTEVTNKDVTVNVMPKNGTPISIGNVASILGEDSITTDDKATEKVKELIDNTNKLYENNKNKVATGTDILALAKAGISFEGNTGSGDKIHRNLGEQVTIKGEGTDGKNNFTSASGNIQVKSDKAKGELTVKLSDKLTNMTSFETKELDDNGNKSKVKLDKEGLTTINKTDDNKYIMSKAGPNGTEIGKYDVNPLMNGNNKAQPTTSAKYTLEGTTIKDDKGSSNLTSNTLTLKDKDDKQRITLDNKAETPTISLSNKEGEETVKIDGGDGKDKESSISFKVDKDKVLGVVKG